MQAAPPIEADHRPTMEPDPDAQSPDYVDHEELRLLGHWPPETPKGGYHSYKLQN